jgi:hypothetical protein
METIKQQLEVNAENINKAFEAIKEYATKKNYVITGNLVFNGFTNDFPSQRAKKKFRNSLNRVIAHPTMKSANLFLHHLSKVSTCTAKIEYSAKEHAIINKRKAWKEAKAIAEKLMKEYKDEKGNYYKQS